MRQQADPMYATHVSVGRVGDFLVFFFFSSCNLTHLQRRSLGRFATDTDGGAHFRILCDKVNASVASIFVDRTYLRLLALTACPAKKKKSRTKWRA
jgi:hypothetical protein